MVKPNLLLCFDAFGTLFRPKSPIAQQYGQVARQLGISGFTDEELTSSVRASIQAEAEENPNYGKATGLGATTWWTNVIRRSFEPFLGKNQVLPPDLAPRLLHRFSSNEGYESEPHLISRLKTLKQQQQQHPSPTSLFNDLVVGVVTNSDDRVPHVLTSLGLNVSALRYGALPSPHQVDMGEKHDIDFHCMSYDVGVEKPHSFMFQAAELMLAHHIFASLSQRGSTFSPYTLDEARTEAETWTKVHVGDEYAKDVVGAMNAGWNSVLLDTEGRNNDDIPLLEDCSSPGTLEDLFGKHAAVRVRSLHSLIGWLRGESRI